jgi:membrane protein DedA with SNARE-associated domain
MQPIITWLNNYIEWIERLVTVHIILAPLLLLFVEEAGVPIFVPGDAILAYTGYGISKSHSSSIFIATFIALIAIIAGSSILFFAARKWGQWLIIKIGRFIFLKQSRIDKAEQLFIKYGFWTIIFGRHIPGMRIPITLLAGSSGIRYRTFIISTVVSTLAWVLLYLNLGSKYGSDIQKVFHRSIGLTFAIFAVIILVIICLHIIGTIKERQHIKTK